MALTRSSEAIIASVPGYNALQDLYKNAIESGQVGAALKKTFYTTNDKGEQIFQSGRAATAAFATMLGGDIALGGARGAFTDSSGNFDMPGIPFI